MSTPTGNIMNGVSRFLSRRDKNGEKRRSKHARSKVLQPFLSTPMQEHACGLFDGSETLDALPPVQMTRRSSLISLYHKLPSMLLPADDVFLLWRKKSPCGAGVTPFHVQVSTSNNAWPNHDTSQSRTVPSDLYTIFSNQEVKFDKEDEKKKVQTLVQRLKSAGITSLGETQAEYALHHYPNDLDRAYDLLLLANDSFDGILKDFDPQVKLLGAINRNMVTCYLDALLFAMFARLDSFEAMLFDNFSDEPRKRLAAILRLWVNLLRSGELIRVDLTQHLQEALGSCGWDDATAIRQQDSSEAFTFITGALELPLLTLKMDIYHTGREDKEDDHKFVNERLLEVAIPEQEGDKVVTLEDCLEEYFNNRIEVKRYLQRQNTLPSIRSFEKSPDPNQTIHIETVELSGSESPLVSTPTTLTPLSPLAPVRPVSGRRRGDSIFSERYSEKKPFDEKRLLDEMLNDSTGRPRSASIRKEVMMPAWQFFSLIPWYTHNVPQSDAQVAAHFSAKRPILGICLKRYTMLPNGAPKRLGTFIDIPLEIGLPHFISDDRMKEEGPLFGNFKLVLQSVVCHRGVSVDSGHYIALVRANERPHQAQRPGTAQSDFEENPDSWLRFDDLASERISKVDIKKALTEESPYLLFYQVQPIDEALASRGDPPSYAESQHDLSADPSRETLASAETLGTDATITDTELGGEWEKVPADFAKADSAPTNPFDEPIGRNSTSSIGSIQRGRTAPATPDADRGGFLSTNASRRNSKGLLTSANKSRPSSQSGENNRLSITLSRLTGRSSKDKLQITETATVNPDEPVIVINEINSQDSGVNKHAAAVGPTAPAGTANLAIKGKDVGSGAAIGVGRSKSKREKIKEVKRLRSKSREPGEKGPDKGKSRARDRPDRECIVM
ncbi:cysteine proteinase [Polyplosphaeria fusca]|uniref:ubiquitinyl hydrolase 1 n=1 Tax=Polyplosphaeria fusca TaxID=682080 RepID=A0A9P4UYS8_9PLEO|nr:cysteine proteinase [Polyplosphaeria fusca]